LSGSNQTGGPYEQRLKRERDEARAGVERLEEALRECRDGIVRAQLILAEHQAENDQLREALRFYAERYGVGSVLASDGGKRAREALSPTQPNTEEGE
jgi:transcriptional accessory protein Tex/SPT6